MATLLTNPFQYTSKTFESLLNDINNDSELVDKPNWWKRGICGIGDVIAMWNNALANNLFLRTAYTRRNVQLLLELIDYQMTPHTTANGNVIFYIKGSASFPFTVQKENIVALTTGSITVSSKRYEARSNVTVNAVDETFTSTEVNTTNDTITVTRDYTTGEKVRFTTTNTLPLPLAIDTDYYVIRVDATTIKIATSISNAYAGTQIDLTSGGTGTHTIHLYSFITTLYQQQTKDQFSVGVSDGVSGFQEFDLSDKDILEDTLQIEVNSFAWTKVETWIDSAITDKHYRLFYNTDNTAKIQFGDGVNFGAIPPVFDIYVNYAYGGNAESNVTVVNRVNIYGGSDSNIEGVSNSGSLTGGADPQLIENAKILGPALLKARNRFVTSPDGEALALAYGGIALVGIIKNKYGPLSCKVVCITTGGGNPSAAIKTALQQYLIDRTILESIDVRVEDTTITSTNVTSAVKVLPGYAWSGIEDYFRLAWKLFFSETGQEIKDDYISNGIESAIELINNYFTESFGETDYTQIRTLLDNLEPRQIGDTIQEDDAIAYIRSSIAGIDYMTITLPAFPISLVNDEITTDGILTLTEIP
jgi:hypothetical protein